MPWLLRFFIARCKPKTLLVLENVCLRQQLPVLTRKQKYPRILDRDRRFWMLMCRWFAGWKDCLVIVKPETVLRWHAQGWRTYWRWRSKQGKPGRKRIPLEVRELIRRVAQENPLWGQTRIMAELLKLGFVVSPRTVRKYMRRPYSGPPSPHWRDFLKQHARDIWACDFLCVRTLTFQTLYVFFLIHHATREIVHSRVTQHPTAIWTGQQIVNACYDDSGGRQARPTRDLAVFNELLGRDGSDLQRRRGDLGIGGGLTDELSGFKGGAKPLGGTAQGAGHGGGADLFPGELVLVTERDEQALLDDAANGGNHRDRDRVGGDRRRRSGEAEEAAAFQKHARQFRYEHHHDDRDHHHDDDHEDAAAATAGLRRRRSL